MLLVIDNYDSFTYNLVQYLGELRARPQVFRNDKVSIAKIRKLAPAQILISPGPGSPLDAGISNDVIRTFSGKIPILGVCLGHQCIGQVFGSKVVRARRIMHGKTSPIHHDGSEIFRGLPNPFRATRYHSLIIDRASLSDNLKITAWTQEGEIMGIRHHRHPTWGVQFHPESVMTEEGMRLLANFLTLCRPRKSGHHS